MENVNLIIFEEKKNGKSFLEKFLIKRFREHIAILNVVSKTDELLELIQEENFNLLILDTDTSTNNIFDSLEPYMDLIVNKELIVISSKTDYAIESFKYSALDYVLKPLDAKELEYAMYKAIAEIRKHRLLYHQEYVTPREPVKIVAIPSLTEVKILPVNTIIYLQSEGKYTTFYTTDNKSIVSSRNLGVYEKLLENNNFFRIHHSYIVNVDLASNVYKKDGTYLEVFNKKYLPISKRKAEAFYKFLGI